MLIDNKIAKTISGPSIFLGITFLFLGFVFLSQQSWIFGCAFLVIASFLFLTHSGVEIDTEKQQIKSYYKIFGFIKRGKWETLNRYKGVTLVTMKKVRTTFSRSNRQNTSSERFFMIYLVNKKNKPEIPIKRCVNQQTAQDSLDEFSIWLKMPVFSIKR